jgi:hypothetical protein
MSVETTRYCSSPRSVVRLTTHHSCGWCEIWISARHDVDTDVGWRSPAAYGCEHRIAHRAPRWVVTRAFPDIDFGVGASSADRYFLSMSSKHQRQEFQRQINDGGS